MRGEYTYLAAGEEYARERFSVARARDGSQVLQSRVSAANTSLCISLEMQLSCNGLPLRLALAGEYQGVKGTAEYSCMESAIAAVVRSGRLERRLQAQVAQEYVVMPHHISAYGQFVRYSGNPLTETLVCWVDVFDTAAFLRPRLRRVQVRFLDNRCTQTVTAGVFRDLLHLVIEDPSPQHPLTGEGYLHPSGYVVAWRQPEGDASYILSDLSV